MPQLVLTGHRVGYVNIPASSANVAAGNFTGTNAAISSIGGTASGRTRVKQVRVSVLGSSFPNENYLRIYKYHAPTTTHYLIRHEYLSPTRYSTMSGGATPPIYMIRFPHDGVSDEILYSPDYRLSFQLESVPSAPLLIEITLADYDV